MAPTTAASNAQSCHIPRRKDGGRENGETMWTIGPLSGIAPLTIRPHSQLIAAAMRNVSTAKAAGLQ